MLSALVDPSLSGGLEGLALEVLPWAGDAVGALPSAEGHLKKKKKKVVEKYRLRPSTGLKKKKENLPARCKT